MRHVDRVVLVRRQHRAGIDRDVAIVLIAVRHHEHLEGDRRRPGGNQPIHPQRDDLVERIRRTVKPGPDEILHHVVVQRETHRDVRRAIDGIVQAPVDQRAGPCCRRAARADVDGHPRGCRAVGVAKRTGGGRGIDLVPDSLTRRHGRRAACGRMRGPEFRVRGWQRAKIELDGLQLNRPGRRGKDRRVAGVRNARDARVRSEIADVLRPIARVVPKPVARVPGERRQQLPRLQRLEMSHAPRRADGSSLTAARCRPSQVPGTRRAIANGTKPTASVQAADDRLLLHHPALGRPRLILPMNSEKHVDAANGGT